MKKQIYNVYSPSGFHWVGNGFKSNNYDIPQHVTSSLMDPFLMVGFAPPKTFEPSDRPRGVGAHPHAGFETVTIVYEGELAHADSAGNKGVLREGGVQWMTAGRGLMHEEFHSDDFSRNGGILSMSQLWVNLPAHLKKIEPAYQDIDPEEILTVSQPNGLRVSVITGTYQGVKGPASTHTPIMILDVHAMRGQLFSLDIPAGFNSMVLVVSGTLSVLDRTVDSGDLIVFDKGGRSIDGKASTDARLVVLSGRPIEEPVVHYGPFVASSQEDLMAIFRDYESGKMGAV